MSAKKTVAALRNQRNAEKRELVLKALRDGASVAEAAEAAGIGRTTLWRWRQEDEDFAVAYYDAEEHGTDYLEKVARHRAVEGSDTLLIFLLKARRPEKYRDSMKIETTVNSVPGDLAKRAQEIMASDPDMTVAEFTRRLAS